MRLLLPSGRESLSAFGFGKRGRAAMGYYVGLDVSLKSTHICVLDGERRVVWRGVSDTQIAMIAEHLARWGEQIVLVGLETGSLTPWLYHGLSDLGLPMVCMDAKPGFGCAVEGGGKRRAGLPQLSITLARPVVRQARQEGGSATLVELVVNQRDKFGVIIGHECDCQTPPS